MSYIYHFKQFVQFSKEDRWYIDLNFGYLDRIIIIDASLPLLRGLLSNLLGNRVVAIR